LGSEDPQRDLTEIFGAADGFSRGRTVAGEESAMDAANGRWMRVKTAFRGELPPDGGNDGWMRLTSVGRSARRSDAAIDVWMRRNTVFRGELPLDAAN
jgi:hypothetical protein